MKYIKLFLLVVSIFFLAACGGGSSGSPSGDYPNDDSEGIILPDAKAEWDSSDWDEVNWQ